MDIEDDFEFGLTKPVNDFIDIEDVESDTSEEVDIVKKSEEESSEKVNLSEDVDVKKPDPEEKSSEKVNLSAVLDNICLKFDHGRLVPSGWPFLVGNLVCFRPSKTSQWLDGKVEVKIPGVDGGEIRLIISSVNNPALTHQIPARQDLIKSNKHSAETLNNLDLQFQPRKFPRRNKTDKVSINKNGKTCQKEGMKVRAEKAAAAGDEKSATLEARGKRDSPAISIVKTGKEEIVPAPVPTDQGDLLADALCRVDHILKENSSGRLACVDNIIKTGVAKEVWGLTLKERICRMFKDNNEKFTGIDLENLKDDDKDLEDLVRSLSREQVENLVLRAESDLVKVVSSRSSFQVGKLLLIFV